MLVGVKDDTHVLAVGTERAQLVTRHFLLVFEREPSSRVFPLPAGDTVLIGRGEDATLKLLDTSVSRRHATITRTDDGVMLTDLGSQNGTLINGERVVTRRLVTGDTIAIGAATLIYHASVARGTQPEGHPSGEVRTIAVGDVTVVIADPAMAALYELVERLAASELPVLVCGETGTGKEVVACALHQMSRRASNDLVSLNCAAIHENLVESELFGHERGAFSGAVSSKPGLLETASGGTVFLDEIGELPLDMQPKLLRALEDRVVKRLGSVDPVALDVRVVAAISRTFTGM